MSIKKKFRLFRRNCIHGDEHVNILHHFTYYVNYNITKPPYMVYFRSGLRFGLQSKEYTGLDFFV